MAYLKRVSLAMLALIGLLTIGCITLAECTRSLEPTPDTWREGACIWKCEPINAVPLSHRMWKQDNRWLCECGDGHIYVIH